MDTLPLHPGLVHLPLGITFLLPLLGLGVAFAITRGWFPRVTWTLVVLTAAMALGTAVAAKQSGEEEEHRVEKALPKDALRAHEQAAELFVIALGIGALAAGGLFAVRNEKAFRAAMLLVAMGFFGVLALGLRAGRLGGELVFHHGVPTTKELPIKP